ncbi:MAG: hypothetical protein GTN70_07020 [Deltaproteobacteria bacterium]|nr:hypothetical protein [Deltaproteobacteria bacterium]NIS77447.1 hypothetical protein [Deltaproteobacteria bacterium]
MLRTFRKHTQSWMIKGVLWLVVAAFIGTIFLVWGRGGDVSKADMAATVNDRIISLKQYYDEYQNLEQVYREVYGNLLDTQSPDTDTLKREALENLINRELFREAAEELNIVVTPPEVQAAISQTPAFLLNGQFDRERYLSILRTNGITPKDFEAQMSLDLKLKKLQGFISGTVKISEKEIQDRYSSIKREIRLNYIPLDPAAMTVEPPSSEEVAAYYADNKESFRVPARVTVEYAVFRPDDFISNIAVTDAEIKTYHEANPDRYLAPERRRFHEISLPYTNSRERKENLESAGEIREEIVSGNIAFIDGVEKHSKGKGEKSSWYEKKDLPRGAGDTLFSLAVDTVTEPIDTGSAVKIFKVAEIRRSDPYPIEEVREKVIGDLKRDKSHDIAIIRAYEAKGRIAKGETFKEVMADYGIAVKESGLLSHGEAEPMLKNVISSSYLLNPGETGEVQKSGNNHIVFRVVEKKASTIKPLEETKKEVREIIAKRKKYQKALNVAKEIIAAAKKEGELKKAAAKYTFTLKKTPFFSPLSLPGIPGIGILGDSFESVLSLGKTDRIAANPVESGSNIYVFEFAGEKEISSENYDEEMRQIADIMLEQKKSAALRAFLSEQREKSTIEISAELNITPSDAQ